MKIMIQEKKKEKRKPRVNENQTSTGILTLYLQDGKIANPT